MRKSVFCLFLISLFLMALQTAESVAAVDNYVWVTLEDEGAVTRIDKSNLTTTGIPLGITSVPIGVAGDNDYVWVADSGLDLVTRIDKSTLATTDIPVGDEPWNLAVDEQYVWVGNLNDGTVTRIDKSNEPPTTYTFAVGDRPITVAVDEDYVWVVNDGATPETSTVSRINKLDLTDIETIEVADGPRGIAVDDTYVWVVINYDFVLTRITKSNLSIINIPVGDWPVGVAVDEDYVWVGNSGSNTVRRINKSDPTSFVDILVGDTPLGIGLDRDYVWVANYGDETDPDRSDTVTRITRSDLTTVDIPVEVVPGPPPAAPAGFSDMTGYAFDFFWNDPPMANAGPNQTVSEGDLVTLDGTGSTDPEDGTPDLYQWEQTGTGPSVTLSDSTAVQPTFTAPNLDDPPTADAGGNRTVPGGSLVTLDGSNSTPFEVPLTFQLTVTDYFGLEDTDTSMVTVTGAEIVTYQWEQTGGTTVTLTGADTAQPTFTAPNVLQPPDIDLTFRLTVTDNDGRQGIDTCTITVSWKNDPPTADAGGDQDDVDEGTTVYLDGSGSTDPDDDIATYLWEQTAGSPTVRLSDPTVVNPTFVTPPVDPGGTMTLTFRLTVTDTGSNSDSDEVDVTIDDNGITDFDAVNPDAITFISSTGQNMGLYVESGGQCTLLEPIDPSTIPDTAGMPENLIYGLIRMQINTTDLGGTATVRIYLPAPAPPEYKWYKYGSTSGWYDYSANAVFNGARDEVTLTMVDGDVGDDDGVVNGVIDDPSGLGTAPPAGAAPAGGGGGGGCFISTATSGFHVVK